jgi:hypothetical protein
MASSFAWLDYSEHERRKMLDTLDLFREKDTRDELGLGTIRDAFADSLFPGTSTVQTRARYFLFVPWIYLNLERKVVAASEIVQRGRREETRLINELVEAGERDGVIGIEARETLQRLPSNVYWQGLGLWRIRLFPGSQEQYHRALDRFYLRDAEQLNDDKEPVAGRRRANWDPRLPPIPAGFPKDCSFRLTRTEAEYLRDRVTGSRPGSLLSWLTEEGVSGSFTEFPWQHPQYGSFPPQVREQLEYARTFSEVMHGAALLYNLMLAEASANAESIKLYQRLLTAWSDTIEGRRHESLEWDEPRFWKLIKETGALVSIPTEGFVSRWFALTRREPRAMKVSTSEEARRLIVDREQALKGNEARLRNHRALERWNGAAGAGQLNYRWPKAQAITTDILKGLKRRDSDA